jgi:hypothetical protein
MGPALTQAVVAAVQAAARDKQLRPMLESLDSIGAGAAAEPELLRLCSDPGTAEAAFALLRDRIGQSAGTAALAAAYERAKQAAPEAPSVLDHGRYLELFRALSVDSSETAAAMASEPTKISARITHALLMLRRKDPAAARRSERKPYAPAERRGG